MSTLRGVNNNIEHRYDWFGGGFAAASFLVCFPIAKCCLEGFLLLSVKLNNAKQC